MALVVAAGERVQASVMATRLSRSRAATNRSTARVAALLSARLGNGGSESRASTRRGRPRLAHRVHGKVTLYQVVELVALRMKRGQPGSGGWRLTIHRSFAYNVARTVSGLDRSASCSSPVASGTGPLTVFLVWTATRTLNGDSPGTGSG